MEASLGALVDCLRAVTRPYPDMPSIDVRRAYLACCAPSPWLLVLVLASTGVCTLASQHALPSVLAGFGAAALVWFHSDGPGRLNHLGSPAALALIGLAAWWATHPASGTALHLLIIAAAVLVIALAALRLRTVLHMAMRLQARGGCDHDGGALDQAARRRIRTCCTAAAQQGPDATVIASHPGAGNAGVGRQ